MYVTVRPSEASLRNSTDKQELLLSACGSAEPEFLSCAFLSPRYLSPTARFSALLCHLSPFAMALSAAGSSYKIVYNHEHRNQTKAQRHHLTQQTPLLPVTRALI